MTNTKRIDLGVLAGNGAVRNISGRPRGLSARIDFGLDELDADTEVDVEIVIPEYMDSITPSFFQGLLEASMRRFDMDRDKFDHRYRLVASEPMQRAFERGMRAILVHRDFPQVA